MPLLHVDPRDPRPIWRQIEEGVQDLVAARLVAPGDAVPSVRDLARELQVNPATVAKAYQRLVDGAGCCTAYRLDLASGARRPIGKNLHPLADPTVVGPAAALFRSGDAALVAVDERGRRRVLLPRGS